MTDVIKCTKCNNFGHREMRCLKEWTPHNYTKINLMRCAQCGKNGHFKCTKEYDSLKMKISTRVLDDLNEFVHKQFCDAEIDEKSS